jgi:hypothetical protein
MSACPACAGSGDCKEDHSGCIGLCRACAGTGEVSEPFKLVLDRVISLEERLAKLEKRFPSIEELISRSSFGTPRAVAIRKSAPKKMVERVLARADELAPKKIS